MAMNRGRGYTLTEMMVTVAIVGILSAVAAPLLTQMTNFWQQTTARNNIQRDVRASLDIINRFCRQAKSGTVVIDQATGQPPFSRITRLPAVKSSSVGSPTSSRCVRFRAATLSIGSDEGA